MSTATRLAPPVMTAAGLLIAVVGCTATRGSDSPEPREPPEPVVSVTAATPTASPAPSPGDATGIAGDVVIVRCDLKAGRAVASGTVVNTARQPADFAITITWLPDNSVDPIAAASTTVPAVERAATVQWSITTTLPDRAERCAVNARRGEVH
jgi:hypothetical protein